MFHFHQKKKKKKLKFKFDICSYKGKIKTTYKATTEQKNITIKPPRMRSEAGQEGNDTRHQILLVKEGAKIQSAAEDSQSKSREVIVKELKMKQLKMVFSGQQAWKAGGERNGSFPLYSTLIRFKNFMPCIKLD